MGGNKMSIEVALKLLELAAVYGIPAVQEMVQTINKKDITLQDVLALKDLVKRPEEYYK